MSCFNKVSENNNKIVYDENVDKRGDRDRVCYVGIVLFTVNGTSRHSRQTNREE